MLLCEELVEFFDCGSVLVDFVLLLVWVRMFCDFDFGVVLVS